MAKVKIEIDRKGIGQVLKSDEVRKPLRDIAEKSATRARSTAPVDSGEYKGSIVVESDTTDRAVERVVARDDKAMIIESRTSNLKRALGR
jgi:hypothetical protein